MSEQTYKRWSHVPRAWVRSLGAAMLVLEEVKISPSFNQAVPTGGALEPHLLKRRRSRSRLCLWLTRGRLRQTDLNSRPWQPSPRGRVNNLPTGSEAGKPSLQGCVCVPKLSLEFKSSLLPPACILTPDTFQIDREEKAVDNLLDSLFDPPSSGGFLTFVVSRFIVAPKPRKWKEN